MQLRPACETPKPRERGRGPSLQGEGGLGPRRLAGARAVSGQHEASRRAEARSVGFQSGAGSRPRSRQPATLIPSRRAPWASRAAGASGGRWERGNMATGGGAEGDLQRGRGPLPLPARPAARAEDAEGVREKMGWAQVVKNLAEKKGDFREPRRRDEAGSAASGGLGSPAGLAAPNPGDFPPAGRGDPKGRGREPAGEAADACRRKGAGDESPRKKAEVAAAAVAVATPARPGATEDAAERPLQDEPPAAGGSGKGRFLVRICFQGDESACPTRDFVVGALILRSIGMDPDDIYAVIQIPGSREFDVSFRSADKLALFLRVYEEKRELEDCWENFVVLGRSKSSLKTLFILFRNETVDVEDIVTWLKRHCDVLAVPVKVTDRFGIWTGEYKCEIELRQGEGGVRHLPGAFFLGAERGYSWYKGQPKTCFKCGSRTHMSGTCTQDRCFRCGEEGHLSPYCRKVIVCNLCGKRGHAFAQCPKAVHNSVAAQLTGVAGH
ncbi:zinc finger CCHC domain-containing protein 3 isoform X2 [Cricetulus griseus]|uniref:Zinc finger CCHC domain-containing protein 3 isoform X2 n=2 Tax=Cricetulus griseus TaxID=10029 RepID=A0A9J7G887_CRIGR|nr:zinc finger CCHC domain-containing protein 3 isoform X2 [Cricetulus griseus]